MLVVGRLEGGSNLHSGWERDADAFRIETLGDVLEEPVLGHEFVRVVFHPSIETEDLGVFTEFIQQHTRFGCLDDVGALTKKLKRGVLHMSNVLVVLNADIKHEGNTAALSVATTTGVVDDRGVHEVVVRNHDEVFANGQDLGGEDTNRHHRPEVAVNFDAVSNFERLVESEHEGVDDVSKRLLHGQANDERKDRQGGEQSQQLEAQFVQSQVETAKPNGCSKQKDDQRVAA